jgi:2-C-methyl-D-erythritol 4-phosphate cytidylyltransferase
MLEWSLDAIGAAGIDQVVVAVPPGHEHDPPAELGSGASGPAIRVLAGGPTRARSVANALDAVEAEIVAVHDAARPLVTAALIEAVLAALIADPEAVGAIAAAPVTDTIKRAAAKLPGSTPYGGQNPEEVVETLDRGALWAAQTPQAFRAAALREALAAHPEAGAATDEAMLVEAAGGRVLIHPAPPENLKVTTRLDLRLAELLLAT